MALDKEEAKNMPEMTIEQPESTAIQEEATTLAQESLPDPTAPEPVQTFLEGSLACTVGDREFSIGFDKSAGIPEGTHLTVNTAAQTDEQKQVLEAGIRNSLNPSKEATMKDPSEPDVSITGLLPEGGNVSVSGLSNKQFKKAEKEIRDSLRQKNPSLFFVADSGYDIEIHDAKGNLYEPVDYGYNVTVNIKDDDKVTHAQKTVVHEAPNGVYEEPVEVLEKNNKISFTADHFSKTIHGESVENEVTFTVKNDPNQKIDLSKISGSTITSGIVTQIVDPSNPNRYHYKITDLDKYIEGETVGAGNEWTYSISEMEISGFNKPRYILHGSDTAIDTAESTDNGGTIVNDRSSIELPETGGPGTIWMFCLGVGFVLIALLGFVTRSDLTRR